MYTKRSKTVSSLLLFILVLTLFTPLRVLANEGVGDAVCRNSDKAFAVYLYNPEKNDTLYAQNIDATVSPASTVKMMTALVAMNSIKDLNATVTVTSAMIDGIETNAIGLKVGEKIKIRDLMIALVCGGYNDAAQALAVISSGSVKDFVLKMNKTASSIGALHTIYKEPTGIDDSAQTTAYDTMLIASEFMKSKTLLDFSSLPSHTIPETNLSNKRQIHNRNALKSSYTGSKYLNANALGMNAGVTYGGGYCVVTGVVNGDMSYICVVMGAQYDSEKNTIYSYVIANELLSQVTRLGYREVISSSDTIGELPVKGSNINQQTVTIRPQGNVNAYLPADYMTSGALDYKYIYYNDSLVAPIKKGDTVGKIIVSYGDEIVALCDMVAAEDVERSSIVYAIYLIREGITGRAFILILISFVSLFLIKNYTTRTKYKRRSRHSHKF